ncbi:hypothetical protein ACFTXJ_26615 [Streptomyces zhihengii]|uniref:hypothetical protein n=1 Tax=Streptomyces zhihengii TaxID=1818004 RepID=UPI00362E5F93
MGRPEKPVDITVPARAKLAEYLRSRKAAAGMTYQALSDLVHGMPSKATLERGASGTVVPAWDTVRVFVEKTASTEEDLHNPGETISRAHQLWVQARRATRAPYYVHKAPDPTLITTRADLSRSLRDQHVWAGYPSPGEMERMLGPGLLPSTTCRRIIKGMALPVDTNQMVSFLMACDVPWFMFSAWTDAADRALRTWPNSEPPANPHTVPDRYLPSELNQVA